MGTYRGSISNITLDSGSSRVLFFDPSVLNSLCLAASSTAAHTFSTSSWTRRSSSTFRSTSSRAHFSASSFSWCALASSSAHTCLRRLFSMRLAFTTSSSSSISGLSSTEGTLAQSQVVGVVVVDLAGADMLIGKQGKLWFKGKLVSLL